MGVGCFGVFLFPQIFWQAVVSSSASAALASGGKPPLEEAMWLLTSSENFQSRTLSECPPMQILASRCAERMFMPVVSCPLSKRAAMSQIKD